MLADPRHPVSHVYCLVFCMLSLHLYLRNSLICGTLISLFWPRLLLRIVHDIRVWFSGWTSQRLKQVFKSFSWKCFGSDSNICKTMMFSLSGGINKCNERVSPEGCTRPWETSRSDKVAWQSSCVSESWWCICGEDHRARRLINGEDNKLLPTLFLLWSIAGVKYILIFGTCGFCT